MAFLVLGVAAAPTGIIAPRALLDLDWFLRDMDMVMVAVGAMHMGHRIFVGGTHVRERSAISGALAKNEAGLYLGWRRVDMLSHFDSLPLRIPSTYRESCSQCERQMFRACRQCGRAFCLNHFVRSTGHCLACADRCSQRSCEMLTSTRCKRCGDSLCASHRHKASERCQSCERWFRNEVSKLEESESADAGERRADRIGRLALLGVWAVMGLSVVGGLTALLALTGVLISGALHFGLGSGRTGRLRGKARRRFLAERPPKLLGS